MHAHLLERLSSSHQRTNLTYQPHPARLYILVSTNHKLIIKGMGYE